MIPKRSFTLCHVLIGLLAAMPLSMAGDGTSAGAFNNKRVLVIGIDGLRSDALQAADTPNMDALIAAGTVTYDAFAGGELGGATQQSTVSGPGWASILTGVWANKHGVTNNSFSGRQFGTYPHFFQRIGETNGSAALASFSQWEPIDSFIVAPSDAFIAHRGIGNTSQEIANQVIAYLGNNDPDVVFLHLDDIDHAGHSYGYGPQVPAYQAAVHDVDRNIGEIITAMKARPNYANEDWLVVITTDHGGSGTGHGGQTPGERTIFMIASGGTIPVQTISPGPGHTALPPTVVSHLGVAIDPAWGWENEPFGQLEVCLNSLACETNPTSGTVTLSWNAPDPALDATGIRVERDGQQIAELPLTATGWVDNPTIAETGVSEFQYTVHTYGGSEGDTFPVRTCSAQFFAGLQADGLIGYYPFDGDTADDISAAAGGSTSNNAGLWTGTAGFKDGAFGRAAKVGDGAGSNFITASGPEYDFGATGSFTVIYWLNLKNNVSSDPVIMAGGGKNWSSSGSTRGWTSFLQTGDDVGANIGDGSKRADAGVIDLDHDDYWAGQGQPGEHWNFVAVVVDRNSQTLTNYVADDWVTATNPIIAPGVAGRDFGPDNSTPTVHPDISQVGNLTNGNLNIVMGQDGDGAGYSLPTVGLDDVSVWNRPLSRAEIWHIYAEGRANGKSLGAILTDGKQCPAALQGAVTFPNKVSLSWSAAAGLDATGIEILRDNSVIATLPLTDTSFIDHPSAAGSTPVTYEYRLRITGADAGHCPELTYTAIVGGNPFADLVLDLRLNGNAQDTSGRGNNGSISGTPGFVSGVTGQALDFNDLATPHQYVSLGTPADLNFGSDTDFTVSVWVKNSGGFPNNSGTGGSNDDPAIISNKNWFRGFHEGWHIGANTNGGWWWNIGDGTDRQDYKGPANEITDGKWHHILVSHTRDTNATLYFDGQQVAVSPLVGIGNIDSGLPTAVATDGTFGTEWASWFNGSIDAVRIWRRALHPAEVPFIFQNDSAWLRWREANFSPVQLDDLAISGPNADPDFDGWENLFEFATGGDAMVASPEIAPILNMESGFPELSYRRLSGGYRAEGIEYLIGGVRYLVEHSLDLEPTAWQSGTELLTEVGSPVDNGDGTETATVRGTLPIDGESRQFLRLRVQLD